MNDAEALFCTECGNRLNTQPAQPMTYTVPEADEAVETTVAEAMPEESESEKVDSKEVDSEETVTEVDDTQEPVTEKIRHAVQKVEHHWKKMRYSVHHVEQEFRGVIKKLKFG